MKRSRAAVFVLLLASFAVLFKDVMVKLVSDWRADENYSHGFLVLPLAIYMVWRQRHQLASIPVRPSLGGFWLIAGSILTLAAGRLGAELYLTRLAMIVAAAGVVAFLWGFRHLRAISFAFLLVFLSIPIPAIVFNQIAFPLQLLASRFGETAISACGIPVLREGNIIVLASTTLEVAEACSGIRSLVSLLTLALVWGYFSDAPGWLRWLLALSSIPIAVFSNGIRVAGTGIAAYLLGPAAAEGFFHTFSGWIVFIVAVMLLLVVHRLGVWVGRGRASGQTVASADVAAQSQGASVDTTGPQRRLERRALIAAGCLGIAAASLNAMTRTEATGLRQPLATLPLTLGGWEGENGPPFDAQVLKTLGVDDYITRAYHRPGSRWVNLYVGYYKSQRQGQTMHSPLNCMPGAGWEPIDRSRVGVPTLEAGDNSGLRGEMNRLVIQKGLDRQLVLYWYQAHGRIVASEYWGKIYTVVDAVRLNRSNGSMVRVIVPITSADPAAERAAEQTALDFVRMLVPVLSTHLD